MAFLKAKELVTVEVRAVVTESGTFPNCAFIEPLFDTIKEMSFPSPEKTGDRPPKNGRKAPEKRDHSETSSETSSETTTDAPAKSSVVANSNSVSEQPSPESAEDQQPSPEDRLFEALAAEGMGEAQARQAASENFPKAEYQLANLRYALPDEKLIPADRGKWLFVAIRNGYGPTKGYQQHLDAERKAQEAAAGRAAAQARQATRLEAESAKPTTLLSTEERLALLPPEEQASLRQRARNAMPTNMRLRRANEAKNSGREKMVDRFLRRLLDGVEVEDHGEWKMSDEMSDDRKGGQDE